MPKAESSKAAAPLLETALGLIGGGVVLALVGFLLFSALRGEGRGLPEIRVETMAPAQLGPTAWVVPFRAVNNGPAPASQLILEAKLLLPDGRLERSEVVIDHLAGRAEQEGGFFFADDPSAGRLTARALGFLQP